MVKQDSSKSPPITTVEDAFKFAKEVEYDGNSLTIWRDFKNCYDEGEPIPDAILQYFSEVASKLLAIENPDKEAPNLIQEALKIKGRDFAAYHVTYKREKLIIKQLKTAKLTLKECGLKGGRENAVDLVSDKDKDSGVCSIVETNNILASTHEEFIQEQVEQLGETIKIYTVKNIHDKYMGRKAKKQSDALNEKLSDLSKRKNRNKL